ncbi:DUF5765 domain-containing protein [Leisingera aquimarina]|uniref:DUF5765 domain-containing protein n=1 Tax=Leisingera aquimarina TaxID=476529 RepID=UPI00047F5821|nr:DUF5765 domain-containing protein [Leisingera aquimarina]
MCWSAEASAAMVVAETAAAVVCWRQGQPLAVWGVLGYFTVMEALQLAGYQIADDCSAAANKGVTLLSYLHIAFQPLLINAFALELVPAPVSARCRPWVLGLGFGAAGVMLLQLLPMSALGSCAAGAPLCAEVLCTVSGTWHIAWNVPYNGLLVPLDNALGVQSGFPAYMAAVFALPLAYGAWRFVMMHLFTGPVLAWTLTSNPNEMPAVWCLFSIVILCIGLSSWMREAFTARSWWGLRV